MDKALQDYYENRFEMMSSTGWKDLIEDATEMLNEYGNINNLNSEADLFFRKGQVDILTWLVSLKDVSERAWEELNEENV
jgi:hypothetical protein